MFEGNEYTHLEIMDSKLSSALNNITWALSYVGATDLSRVQQKTVRRALTTAKQSLSKSLRVIDENH